MTRQQRQERAQAMCQLYQEGYSVQEIAQRCGVSSSTIYKAFRQNGLIPSGRGRGWYGNSESHAAGGRQGGLKTSADRAHMSEIGRKGGRHSSQDRARMAEIGKKGGQARAQNAKQIGFPRPQTEGEE